MFPRINTHSQRDFDRINAIRKYNTHSDFCILYCFIDFVDDGFTLFFASSVQNYVPLQALTYSN